MKMPESPKTLVTSVSQICKGLKSFRHSIAVSTVRQSDLAGVTNGVVYVYSDSVYGFGLKKGLE
jgi:hypothetical protein